MKVNCLSITFWFNIIDNENEVLKSLQEEFDDYNKYELFNKTDNYQYVLHINKQTGFYKSIYKDKHKHSNNDINIYYLIASGCVLFRHKVSF